MPGETLLPNQTAPDAMLHEAIAGPRAALARRQHADGHWLFELEADATIPAEYVLLEHFLDRIEPVLEAKIGVYLRSIQGAHGGWPLFHDGAFDLSASVKAYFALKAIGDDPDAPHMARARQAILAAGGAERTNVFTRAQLALFGQVPWRAVPVMPLEIMHLPLWFPFHLSKVSYWSRTVIVPLLVLMALRPRGAQSARCRDPGAVPHAARHRCATGSAARIGRCGGGSSKGSIRCCAWCSRRFRGAAGSSAIEKAVRFVTERLNGDDGLGGIYPGDRQQRDDVRHAGLSARASGCRDRLARGAQAAGGGADRAYCQPCLSPVWDTGLAGHAMAEAGADTDAACDWLRERQILDVVGDWSVRRPGLRPGGWAFQYANPHYPDVDDTAVVGMLLHRNGDPAHAEAIERAREWIIGMQSSDGGWGAFEPENTHLYLNNIPFADHGALLDPPTADVTARCVSFLAQIGMPADDPVMARALAICAANRRRREAGSAAGAPTTSTAHGRCCARSMPPASPPDDPAVRRAVAWLVSVQREDGGWGEDEETYGDAPHGRYKESTPSQTAWALLGLMAAGEADHPAVARGIGVSAGDAAEMADGASCHTTQSVFRACSTCAITAIAGISR